MNQEEYGNRLNEYEKQQQRICKSLERDLSICNHLNMLCSLRNTLEEKLEEVLALIENVDKDTFKMDIRERAMWYFTEKKTRVRIMGINWSAETIEWCSIDDGLPHGWSTFEQFRDKFVPLWV